MKYRQLIALPLYPRIELGRQLLLNIPKSLSTSEVVLFVRILF